MKELKDKIEMEIKERYEMYDYYLNKMDLGESNSYNEHRVLELKREIMTFEHILTRIYEIEQRQGSDKEKIEELDMRYRLALALLVFRTGEHIDTFIETIDKTIGHKYWNFIGSDKEIERLNKQIEEYQKALDETTSEKIDLENIIKEVREYIEKASYFQGNKILEEKELLEILDKGDKE